MLTRSSTGTLPDAKRRRTTTTEQQYELAAATINDSANSLTTTDANVSPDGGIAVEETIVTNHVSPSLSAPAAINPTGGEASGHTPVFVNNGAITGHTTSLETLSAIQYAELDPLDVALLRSGGDVIGLITGVTDFESQGRTIRYDHNTVTGAAMRNFEHALTAPDIITDDNDNDQPPPLESAVGGSGVLIPHVGIQMSNVTSIAQAPTVQVLPSVTGPLQPTVALTTSRTAVQHDMEELVAPRGNPTMAVASTSPTNVVGPLALSVDTSVRGSADVGEVGGDTSLNVEQPPTVVTPSNISTNALPPPPAVAFQPSQAQVIAFGLPTATAYASGAGPTQFANLPAGNAGTVYAPSNASAAPLPAVVHSVAIAPTVPIPTTLAQPQQAASAVVGIGGHSVAVAPIVPAVAHMPTALPHAQQAAPAVVGIAPPPPVPQTQNTSLTAHPHVYNVSEVPNELVERMRSVSNYVYPPMNIFSMSLVPANSDWGHGKDERFLCYASKPIVLWLPARAKKLWFYKPNGEPQPRVNIGVEPSVAGDLDAVKALYNRARPRAALSSDIVYASRLQTVRERGATSTQATPFEEVYDAIEHFTSKSAMPRIRAADLGEDDIVVVECNFTRWKKPGETKKKMWTAWDVGFELLSISLLYAEPTTANVPEDVPAHATTMFSI